MAESATTALADVDADPGRRKIEWAREHASILPAIESDFEQRRPLEGTTVGMAMHVEAKTAVLVEVLAAGGADVVVTGCNPLSTHDDVSRALDEQPNITSYARRGVSESEYYDAIEAVIDHEPSITVDDGGDLVFRIHREHPNLIERIRGGCEETTTGVHRLRAMAADDELRYPVFAVNDTPTKRLFDNVHGTGESVSATVALTTNRSWAGTTVVVAGFGYCGRGLARKLKGLNARVLVTEVEPRRALRAHMEGFQVLPMARAAERGDVFITTTGNRDVIRREHFDAMADGTVLANAGHFDVEIDLDALDSLAAEIREPRDGVTEFRLPDGRRINVLAEGRLVNLAAPAAQGHPIEVMDQSFGVQALCVEALLETDRPPGVHDVPDPIDRRVAAIKLDAEGVRFDELSDGQREYLEGWEHGT